MNRFCRAAQHKRKSLPFRQESAMLPPAAPADDWTVSWTRATKRRKRVLSPSQPGTRERAGHDAQPVTTLECRDVRCGSAKIRAILKQNPSRCALKTLHFRPDASDARSVCPRRLAAFRSFGSRTCPAARHGHRVLFSPNSLESGS
eukprot:scaffold7352_cov254-Pinguiococcus_pyrenoidosus.AAC.12